jgi:hypothetical protein
MQNNNHSNIDESNDQQVHADSIDLNNNEANLPDLNATTPPQHETKGQLIQRHKREIKVKKIY